MGVAIINQAVQLILDQTEPQIEVMVELVLGDLTMAPVGLTAVLAVLVLSLFAMQALNVALGEQLHLLADSQFTRLQHQEHIQLKEFLYGTFR